MPPIFGRVQITTVEKRDAPSMGIKVLSLAPEGNLVPLRSQIAMKHNLSMLSENAIAADPTGLSAKSQTYLMKRNTDLRLMVRIIPTNAPMKTMVFASTPEDVQGNVSLMVSGQRIVVLSGPLRRLTAAQAKICLGAAYTESSDLSRIDCIRMGVHVNGTTRRIRPRTVTTVDAAGQETTTEVQRRPRQVGK